MLVDVDGVNPAFKTKVIEIVEGIADPMTCTEEDPDKVVPFLKGTLKKSELGSIMMFRVTPHGQYMWIPKRS